MTSEKEIHIPNIDGKTVVALICFSEVFGILFRKETLVTWKKDVFL
jgi:hypothetical protein